MTEKEKSSFHLFFNVILIVFVAIFESSFWPRIFGSIPPPQLWLSIVVFVFLYRSKLESLLIVYLPIFFIFSLMMQPLGFILLAQTILFFLVIAIKNRVFVPGSFYFSVIYSISVLAFNLSLFLLAWIFDIKAVNYPQVWKWVVQAIFAFALSPVIFSFLSKINPIDETASTHREDLL